MVISCHDDNNYMVDEKSRLEAHGVSSWGQVLIVTPNAQRNMFTIITSARHHSIWSILSTTITQWPRSCVPGSASVFTIITNVPATPRAARLLVVQRHSMKLPTGMPCMACTDEPVEFLDNLQQQDWACGTKPAYDTWQVSSASRLVRSLLHVVAICCSSPSVGGCH